MLSVYLIFLIGLLALYFAGWLFRSEKKTQGKIPLEELSVVIPFRDEAKNLGKLIGSLQKQDKFPREIIFVNDHSEDNFQAFFEGLSFPFTLIHLEKRECGKKAALKEGITRASGSYILSLDADVSLKTAYFREIGKLPEADLYVLPVKMTASNGCSAFGTLDFYFLNALNYALSAWVSPIVASGANLLFKKTLYAEMVSRKDGHISSGDDIFLLKEARQRKSRIYVQLSSALTVETGAPQTVRDLLYQRLRWAGKTKQVGDGRANLIGVLGLAYHLLPFFLVISGPGWYWAYLLKMLCDLLVLSPFLLKLRQGVLLFFSPVFSILYPFYLLSLSFAFLMVKPYWKGRLVRV